MDMTEGKKPAAAGRVTGILLKYAVPPVITIGLCWLLFHDMDPSMMWRTIRQECDFRWIWGNFALGLLAHVARAARWRIQLRALGIRPSLWQLVLSIFGTYSVNLVFPRLGEVWRTGYIAQRERAPFTKVFGSMVAERLADTITVGTLAVITFLIIGSRFTAYVTQDPDRFDGIISIVASPVLWVCVALAAGIAAWMWIRYPDNRIVATLRRLWKGLWEGFAVIATMPGKGRWLLLTILLWGSYFTALWCAFRSFPLTAEVISQHGIVALLVCFVFTSLAMGVPSNGGIGPWQWAMIFGLELYAVPGLTRDYAASFANLVMGVQTVALILLGVFTFAWIALAKTADKRHEPDR